MGRTGYSMRGSYLPVLVVPILQRTPRDSVWRCLISMPSLLWAFRFLFTSMLERKHRHERRFSKDGAMHTLATT
jgi:hypothetical protein